MSTVLECCWILNFWEQKDIYLLSLGTVLLHVGTGTSLTEELKTEDGCSGFATQQPVNVGDGVFDAIAATFPDNGSADKLRERYLHASLSNIYHTSHDSVSVVRTIFKVYGKRQTLSLSQPKTPEPSPNLNGMIMSWTCLLYTSDAADE